MSFSIQKYEAAVTGNVTAQAMLNSLGVGGPHTSGIICDVEVDLGTSTTIDVTIADKEGNVFLDTTVTADTKYKIDDALILRNAIEGPLTVTTTNNSNSAHTATIKVWVKTSRG
jgi:hypothetical protein